ncbi:hypothetical protein KKC06_06605 [Patescibacteria group bacterium]|nr:hypothetical protein [Patescibacteria group bacterium]
MLTGKNFDLIIFLLTVAGMYLFMRKAEGGRLPNIRSIPLLEELDSIIGRAAEMGRPVHYTTGYGGLHDEWAVMCVAGLAILSKVAEMCGKYRVWLQFTCFRGYLVPIGQDILKTGYEKGGAPEMYTPDMVTYVGEDQPAYIAYIMDYFMTEKPAVSMVFGAIQAEMNNILMQAARVNAISLAGTPRLYYQGKMALMCDYCLLGEELYVAGASITKDPVHLGCIEAEDWFKVGIIALLVIALILTTLGMENLLQSLLKW